MRPVAQPGGGLGPTENFGGNFSEAKIKMREEEREHKKEERKRREKRGKGENKRGQID